MPQRLPYHRIAPDAFTSLAASRAYSKSCGVSPRLRALLELRVSQINGCVYCCNEHSQEARAAGESQQRLDCLPAWRECELFDPAEKAALAWAEAITRIEASGVPDDVYETVRAHYDEKALVDLTFIVGMMNFWNRMAVSFRKEVAPRGNV